MSDNRFDRQIALFGEAGQAKLRAASVAVIGVGGVGSIVVPELALLGVGQISVVECEELETSNRNRHLCAWATDPIPGTLKVDVAERAIHLIDPTIRVRKAPGGLMTPDGFDAVKRADAIFGCVDREGVRLVLTELCAAYGKSYFDIATDVLPGSTPRFGGRVCCSEGGHGCLICLGLLDAREAAEDLETPDQRRDRVAIYGVNRDLLGRSGPSVVSVNAVVASLAVTEFMKHCTGLARPARLLNYDGGSSRVTVSVDAPTPECYYCTKVWGSGDAAETERFIRHRASAAPFGDACALAQET